MLNGWMKTLLLTQFHTRLRDTEFMIASAQTTWQTIARTGDIAALFVPYSIGISLQSPAELAPFAEFHLLMALGYLLLAEITGAFAIEPVGQELNSAYTSMLTWAIVFMIALPFYLPFTHDSSQHNPLPHLVGWVGVTYLPLFVWRFLLLPRWVARLSAPGRQPAQQVGIWVDSDASLNLARQFIASFSHEQRALSLYSDNPALQTDPLCRGGRDTFIAAAQDGLLSAVFIPLEHYQGSITRELANTSADLFLVPPAGAQAALSNQLVILDNVRVISASSPRLPTHARVLKRLEDLIVALVAIAVFLLPMALIAAAIRLTSPGPILYGQQRMGRDGKPFTLWKFRSMTVTDAGDSVTHTSRDDPRLTAVGRFLRRTSLDELPQLYNVLIGQMSAVGPRPHAMNHSTAFRQSVAAYMQRYKVKPGMTGLAQINGWRGAIDSQQKIEARVRDDLLYIANWSIGLDCKILLKTLLVGFRHDNAY